MNYIKQINAFWRWKELNKISHGEVELYFGLLNCANASNWQSHISIPNRRLISLCGFGDDSALNKARNRLIQSGLIEYKKGKSGQAGNYTVISLYTELDGTLDRMDETNCPKTTELDRGMDRTMDRTMDSIYKKKKKIENKTDSTPLVGEIGKKVDEWLKYKKERGQTYKSVGLKMLYSNIQKAVEEFGETSVIGAIDYSISNNYQGLFFDRLKKPERKSPELTTSDTDYSSIEKQMWDSLGE